MCLCVCVYAVKEREGEGEGERKRKRKRARTRARARARARERARETPLPSIKAWEGARPREPSDRQAWLGLLSSSSSLALSTEPVGFLRWQVRVRTGCKGCAGRGEVCGFVFAFYFVVVFCLVLWFEGKEVSTSRGRDRGGEGRWHKREGGEWVWGSRPRGGQEAAADKTLSLSYLSACRLSFWASTPTRSPYL